MRLDNSEANPFAAPESDFVTDVAEQPEAKPPYAGFLTRIIAIFVDCVILWLPLGLIAITFRAIFESLTNEMMVEFEFVPLVLFYTAIWLYFALQESSSCQATLGKRLMGIKVVDLDGQRISFLRATGRLLGKVVSYFGCLIGYLIQPFTKKRQALHDMLAGTLVIKDRS